VDNIKEIHWKDESGYQVLAIHQKSMFLILALTLTKENRWLRQFRVKRKFIMVIAKKQLPPFLDQNPDITTKIYLCTWEFLFGMQH
jgi:hypothetical protein